MSWNVKILTLFPEMFPGPLGYSIAGKALKDGKWNLDTIQIRDFADDKHNTVDDTPYGGGCGMVMKSDVIGRAIESIEVDKLIYMSPRGKKFNQQKSKELLWFEKLGILCGRYEGVDQRVLDYYAIEEVSIGDFVLSGGEIASFVVIDACVRQIDGVLSNPQTLQEESFGENEYGYLLEYPLYTRPSEWKGLKVPDELLSGNHDLIDKWRLQKSIEITKKLRPDLLDNNISKKTGLKTIKNNEE